jgi:tRNA threonylcarbamoyladenosine biosynthesis protein TsaB
MRLLAIDTASAQCSAALLDGASLVLRAVATQREHAQLLLPMVEGLLREAGFGVASLDAIAFGRGPGSFTGVRVAAAVAQGLALGADLPVLPVSDLRALALQAVRLALPRFDSAREQAVRVACCMDARMNEVYAAAFEVPPGGLPPDAPERVCAPADFRPDWPCELAMGRGFAAYPEALAGLREAAWAVYPDTEPSAGAIAELGGADFAAGLGRDASEALPTYLRDNVARPAPS